MSLVVAGALAAPATASAHAVLTHSTPHADATVQHAPARIVLDFNEAVGVGPGSIRVYDESGERVDEGEVGRPRSRSADIGVTKSLPKGVYTATYRVVSADGHPVSGGVAFGIREAVRVGRSGPSVEELLADQQPSTGVEVAYGIARGLQYLALLLLIGAVPFWVFVWRVGGSSATWPRGVLVAACIAGGVSAVAGLLFQGLLAAGSDLSGIFGSAAVPDSLDSDTGKAWLIRAGGWVGALTLVWPRESWRREQMAWLGGLSAVLVATFPYGGHATTQSPGPVLVAADIVHLVAAGAWLGGLGLLIAAFWPRGPRVGGEAAWLATGAFSRSAVWWIAAVVLAGSLQAWFYLGSLGAFTEGSYGIALLVKIGLVAVIVALGALNRRRVATLGDRSAIALRRAMRAEMVIAVAIISATAVLVRATPPKAVGEGPQQKELNLGPMRLELVVEPATVGRNAFHVYFFNRRTGAQVSRVKELTVTMSRREEGIAPIKLKIRRKGPAHYELLGQPVPVAGDWRTRITVRVSEFDEYAVTTTLRFRKP